MLRAYMNTITPSWTVVDTDCAAGRKGSSHGGLRHFLLAPPHSYVGNLKTKSAVLTLPHTAEAPNKCSV